MRRFCVIIFILLIIPNFVIADRWYVLTAMDIEDNESGYSNVVSRGGSFPTSITFEWTPNSEPDIYGYRLHVKDSLDGAWIFINVDILHLDHCLDKCQKELLLEPITSIQLKEELP